MRPLPVRPFLPSLAHQHTFCAFLCIPDLLKTSVLRVQFFSQPTRTMGLLWVRLLHFGGCNTPLCVQGTGRFEPTTLARFSYGTLAQDSKGPVLGARRGERHLQNSLCCHIWGWTKGAKYTHHELRHWHFQRQLPLLPGTCSISQKGLVTGLLSSHPNVLLISQFTGRKAIRISGFFFFFLAASRILQHLYLPRNCTILHVMDWRGKELHLKHKCHLLPFEEPSSALSESVLWARSTGRLVGSNQNYFTLLLVKFAVCLWVF